MGNLRDILVLWSTFSILTTVAITGTVGSDAHRTQKDSVSKQNRYILKIEWFTRCTRPCGGGTQKAVFVCYDTIFASAVDPSQCRHLDSPGVYQRVCNLAPCRYRWYTTPWSLCSKTCGRGTQNRHVRCVNKHNRSSSVWRCARLTVPSSKITCGATNCKPEWLIGSWSECSALCGEGLKNRTVGCRQTLANGTTVRLAIRYCSGLLPAMMVNCKGKQCVPLPAYAAYEYSGASSGYDIQGNEPVDQEPGYDVSDATAESSGDAPNRTLGKSRPVIVLSKKPEYILKSKDGKITVDVGAKVFAVKGSSITVACRTTGATQAAIEWTYDGYDITTEFEDDVGLVDGNVKIRKVGRFNEGTYKCKASFDHGAYSTALFKVQILQTGAPNILSSEGSFSFGPGDRETTVTVGSTVTVYKGTTLRIKCPVIGKGRLYVYWYSQGRPISVGKAITVGYDLIIKNIDRIYALKFTCHVRNVRGQKNSASTVVRVLDLPPPKIAAEFMVIGIEKTSGKMLITIGTNLTVITGSSVTISCPVETKPHPELSWLARGKVVSGRFEGVEIKDNNSTLVLSSLQTDDSGFYVCIAVNNAGSDKKVTYIKVAAPVKPFILSKNGFKSSLEGDQELSATIGEQVTVLSGILLKIRCSVQGLPTPVISWRINDKNIKGENVSRFSVKDDTLAISEVTKNDEGVVTCFAKNKVGNASSQSKVNVITGMKPNISSSTGLIIGIQGVEEARVTIGQDLRVVEGLIVRLQCPVRGFPKPVISWTRNDQDVKATRRVTIDESNNDLVINGIIISDTGQYICSAVNPVGEDQQASFISIISESSAQISPGNQTLVTTMRLKPVTMVIGDSLTALSGTDVTITCPVRGTPRPFVIWRRRGKKIETGEAEGQFRIEETRKGITVLKIYQVSTEVAGKFECVATNLGGSDRVPSTLAVVEAKSPEIEFISGRVESIADQSPVSTTIGSSVIILTGAKLSIKCPSIGVPRPSITWALNGKPIKSGGSLTVERITLVINETKLEDSGTYTCIASNIVSNDSRHADVNVLVPVKPKIQGSPRELNLFEILFISVDVGNTINSIEGVSLELTCTAQGLPKPNIQWRFGEIVVAGGTLKLPKVKAGDSRRYTCQASNLAGKDSKTTTLIVRAISRPVIYSIAGTVVAVSKIAPLNTTIGKSVTVLKGSHVTLMCHVTAFPPPSVTWNKDTVDVGPNVSPFQQNVTHYGIVINTNRNDEPSGKYTCVATNKGGSVAASSHIVVKAPQKPFIKSTQQVWSSLESRDPIPVNIGDNVEVLSGTQVTLLCLVIGLPPPEITWSNRKQLKEGAKFSFPRQTHLVIGSERAPTTIHDSGRYTCKAVNMLGMDSAYAVIKFKEPRVPKILSVEENFEFRTNATISVTIGANISVVLGSTVKLACDVDGLPNPEIIWSKKGRILRRGIGLFTIWSAKNSDSGQYDCTATNLAGSSTASSTLTVHTIIEKRVKPKILSSSKNLIASENKRVFQHVIGGNITILEGKDVVLQCPTVGAPTPVVSWHVNDEPVILTDTLTINSETAALSIIEITPEEEGKYTCISKNIAGEDIEKTYIAVVGPIPPKVKLSDKAYTTLDPLKKPVQLFIGDKQTTLTGTRTTIDCPSAGFPDPIIRWTRNDESVSPGGHVFINGSQLVLTNPHEFDTGLYTCTASNPGGISTGNSNITFLVSASPTIRTSPDDVVFMKRGAIEVLIGSDVTVLDRSTVNVKCEAQGVPPPILGWRRNGKDIRTTDIVYQLKSVRKSDSGTINCTARNYYGTASEETVITVLVGEKPKIKVSRSSIIDLTDFTNKTSQVGDTVELLANSNIKLLCQATGIPKPLYTWSKNKIPVEKSERLSVDNMTGTLTIQGLNTGHSGLFTCAATNLIGSDEASSSFTIRKPRGPFIKSSAETINTINSRKPVQRRIGSKITVLAGTAITLTCEVDGLPRPTLSWRQDAGSVNRGRVTIQGPEMKITEARVADTGVYTCTASSPAGRLTVSSHITVTAGQKPKIARTADTKVELTRFTNLTTNIGNNISILSRSELRLQCPVQGIPAPAVMWTRRGVPVVPSDRLLVDKVTSALVITRLQVGDSGSFVCTATNPLGEDSASSKVTVIEPRGPFIKSSTRTLAIINSTQPVEISIGANLTALANTTITIQCKVGGLPMPVTSWSRDDDVMISDHVGVQGDDLRIPGARLSDGGVYMCTASSTAGRVNVTSHITVIAGLRPQIASSDDVRTALSKLTNFTVTIGSPVSILSGSGLKILCPVKGIPRPSVSWSIDGSAVTSSNRLVLEKSQNSLFLTKLVPRDSGSFTCTATNLFGDDVVSSWVSVMEPFGPTINATNRAIVQLVSQDPITSRVGATVTTLSGVFITIECQAVGLPVPVVFWSLEGKPMTSRGRITVDKGTLRIDNAGSEDGGRYTCTATSVLGEEAATSVITVQGSERARITSVGKTLSELDDIAAYTFNIGDNITILAGSDISINCPTEGLPTPTVNWRIAQTSALEVRFGPLEQTNTLTITKLRVSDSGIYKCTARNLKGSDQQSSVVTVLDPYGPSIETSTERIVALENLNPVKVKIGANLTALEKTPVSIVCKARGLPVPSVVWIRDGKVITSQGHVTVDKGTLHLKEAKIDDGGVYVCKARTALGEVMASSTVLIRAPVPPTIKSSDEIIESLKRNPLGLIIGQTLRTLTRIVFNVTCKPEGLPTPNITWSKDGVKLPADGRTYARGHVLFIAGSLTSDTGVYVCKATNIAGTKQATSNFTIFEPVEPEITATVKRLVELRPVTVTVEVGSYIRTLETSNITLSCAVRGFPQPTIIWRGAVDSLNGTQGVTHYKIANAKVADSGIYTCFARNLVGHDFRSSYVSIVASKAPVIKTSTKPLEVLRRQTIKTDLGQYLTTLSRNTITLICNASGIPLPTLKWYKDGSVLNNIQMTYSIMSTSGIDSGVYSCQAKNLVGEVTAETNVTILDGSSPSIKTSDKTISEISRIRYIVATIGSSITTLLTSNVEIVCDVAGFPKPTVKWYKDGKLVTSSMTLRVSNDTGTLYFVSIALRRSGVYKCEASNSLGTKSASSNLDVQGLSFPRINISRGIIKSLKSRNPVGINIGQNLTALTRTNISITCPASGVPIPVVTWKRGEIELETDGRVQISGMVLRISIVTREDIGRYVCLVQNVVGELTARSNLNVLDPVVPRIHGKPEILKIFLSQTIETSIGSSIATIPGNKLTITCNASGIPTPNLGWEKDDKSIQEGGTNFTFQSIKVSDSGSYACVATNIAGVDKKTSSVIFLVGERTRITSKKINVIATEGENEVVIEVGGNLTAIVGTGVEIMCPVSGEPVPMITWIRNGTVVKRSSVMFVNSETKALTILGITMEDVGYYTCYANNSFGFDMETTFIEAIAALSPTIRFTKRRLEDYDSMEHQITIGDNLKSLIGSTVTIHCNATGNPLPQIAWSRSGTPITTNYRIRITNNTLEIYGALWSDTAEYECTAVNAAGADKKTSFLKFVPPEKPVIQVFPQVLEVNDRSPVSMTMGTTLKTLTLTPITINCSATGIPSPSYTWTKVGGPIEVGSTLSITPDGNMLTIRDLSMADAGIYQCQATNKAGMDVATAALLLLEPILPQIISTDENITWYDRLPLFAPIGGKITALTGTKVSLTCQANGFPKPRVAWRRDDDDNVLEPDGQYSISNQTIVIYTVQPSDTGLYKCIASNLAGDVEAVTYITVSDPKEPVIQVMDIIIRTEDRLPLITDIGSTVTVLAGTPLSIRCPVQGIPKPTITWSNGGRFLFPSNGNSTLVFTTTTVSHSGEYTCTAMSPIGADTASSLLTVLVPLKPRITTPQVGQNIPLSTKTAVTIKMRDSVSAFLGTVLAIECPTDGLPKPTVSWRKDGQRFTGIVDANDTLSVSLNTKSEEGKYTCRAENTEGTATASSVVTLVEPQYPRIESKKGVATALDARRPIAATVGMTVKTLTSTAITLKCPATGNPDPTMEWSKASELVISGERVFVSSDGSLNILNSKTTDSGKYVCTAKNQLGEDIASSLISVMRPTMPTIPSSTDYVIWYENRPFKSKIGNNLTTMKGRKLTLICPAEGMPRPTITWYRGGEEIRTEDNIVVEGQTVVIYDLSVFDTDRYTCVAENVAGIVAETSTLRVHDPVPPYIYASHGSIDALSGFSPVNVTAGQDVTVPTNSPVILSCPVKGVPRPKIIWINEKDIVVSDSVIEVDCNGTLKLRGVRTKDAGEYICYAESFFGMDMAFTDIKVVERIVPVIHSSNKVIPPGEGRPITAIVGDNATVIEGHVITIKCDSTGIPYPKLTWTRNGVPIQSVGMYSIDSNGALTIRGVRENGVYTCIAHNDQGRDNATTFVTAKEPKRPKILTPVSSKNIPFTYNKTVTIYVKDNVTALPNSTIRIKCKAAGFPTPRVTWNKNGNAIRPGWQYQVTDDGTLVIVRATEVETGSYTCITENIAGRDSATSTVSIKKPIKPVIERPDKPRTIPPGDSSPVTINITDNITVLAETTVTINCRVSGLPKPTISWSKDGQKLRLGGGYDVHDNGSLVIRTASAATQGEYTCTAKNRDSKDKATSIVNTVDPAKPTIKRPDKPRTIPPGDGDPVTVNIGDNVTVLTDTRLTIDCEANGMPKPKITWEKDGLELSIGNGYTIHENGSLVIEKASTADRGQYKCTAKNKDGLDKSTSTVDTVDPEAAKITTPDKRRTIPSGDGNPVTVNIGGKVTVLTNTELTIDCPSSGVPKPTITWRKNGRKINTGDGYEIHGNGTLVIKKALAADRGQYTCTANNKGGQDNATSTVGTVDPKPPKVSRPEKPRTIPPGDGSPVNVSVGDNVTVLTDTKITINCPVTGIPKPTITWTKNGQELSVGHGYVIYENGSIVLNRASVSDRGQYTCTAKNKGGQDKATTTVGTVDPVPPKVTRPDKPRTVPPGDGSPVTVNIGDNVTVLTDTQLSIDCPTSGIPKPSITWSKNGEKLSDGDGYMIYENGTLVITNAKVADRGQYTCVAKNKDGQDKATSNVGTVDPKPPKVSRPEKPRTIPLGDGSPVNVSVGDNVTVLTNTKLTINCPVTGIPKPTITWTKNGQELSVGDGYVIYENGSIVLNRASVSDRGQYTCTAKNKGGQDKATTTVGTVDPVAPKINRPDKPRTIPPGYGSPVTAKVGDNITALTNTTVTINCPSSGIPKPTITWRKDGQELADGHGYIVYQNGSLAIRRASAADRGRYTCTAKNKEGEDTAASNMGTVDPKAPKVTRPDKPRVISPGDGSPVNSNIGDNITALTNTKLYISCPTTGIPKPSVTWSKNGKELSEGDRYVIYQNGTLVIKKASTADRGQYTCTAKNRDGQDKSTSTVDTIDPKAPRLRRPDKPRSIPPGDGSPVTATVGDNITALTNTKLYIDCPSSGVPKAIILWSKGGLKLRVGNGYVIYENGTLLIKKASVEDKGLYTCSLKNIAGEVNTTTKLDIVDPKKPSINKPEINKNIPIGDGEPVKMNIGDNVTTLPTTSISISCESNGIPRPRITWLKDGKPIGPADGLEIYGNGTLVIKAVTFGQAGDYECKTVNIAGEDSSKSKVTVVAPISPRIKPPTVDSINSVDNIEPVVLSVGTNVTALVQTTVSINCVVIGLPKPNVFWSKDDQRLIPGEEYEILDNNTLVIRQTVEDDSGLYMCTARNRAGEDSQSSTVDIIAAEIPVIQRTDEVVISPEIRPVDVMIGGNVITLSGVDITLNCSARGVPHPSIEWMNGGKVLPTINGPRLVLKNLTSSDSGVYTCVASNIAGKAKASTIVNITDPVKPTIVTADSDFVVNRIVTVTKAIGRSIGVLTGSNLVLLCSVSSHPASVVTWSRGDEPITSGPRHIVRRHSLSIFSLRKTDTNEYSCTASNVIGNTTASTELIVKDLLRPTIKVSRTRLNNFDLTKPIRVEVGTLLTTIVNATVMVKCSATGRPDPKISWQRDGLIITSSRKYKLNARYSSLTIRGVQFADEGAYVCTALNREGSDFQRMRMVVTTPPIIRTVKGAFEVTDIRELVSITTGSVVTIPRGVTIAIRCEATGVPEPTITWFRVPEGSKTWLPITARDNHVQVNSDSSLSIKRSNEEDVAQYICVATNVAGRDEGVTYLRIGVAPEIPGHWLGATKFTRPRTEKIKSVATVVRGATLRIRCAAYGSPKPNITWYVVGSQRSSPLQVLPDGTLELDNVDFSDEGNYTCFARNAYGTSTRSTNITVLVPPAILDNFFKDAVLKKKAELLYIKYSGITRLSIRRQQIRAAAVERGGNIIIGCPIKGKPQPNILWLRNGLKVRNDSRHLIFGGIVLIRDIQIEESGEYFCFVKNAAGEDGGGIDLHVREKIIGQWFISRWRECGNCYATFKGFQNRTVECTDERNNSVPSSYCDTLTKPPTRKQCQSRRCETIWVLSVWQPCSAKCGTAGIRARNVRCVFYGGLVPANGLCDNSDRPESEQPCTSKPCGETVCRDKLNYCHTVKNRGMCKVYKKWCCATCGVLGRYKTRK